MENNVIANRYQVLEHLGQGAQATVFLAEDKQEKRKVAVKILGQISGDSAQLVRRFQREFSACKKFDHPNVVKIFDLGRVENGAWFYTMEYLPYPSLRSILNEKKRLPETEAAKNPASSGLWLLAFSWVGCSSSRSQAREHCLCHWKSTGHRRFWIGPRRRCHSPHGYGNNAGYALLYGP